jgi:hypothetical protein
LTQESTDAMGIAEICRDTAQVGACDGLLNGLDGSVDAGLRAAVDYDLRAFCGESGGDCQADASGGTRHYGEFSL